MLRQDETFWRSIIPSYIIVFPIHHDLERGSWFYIILVLLEHAQRVKGYELQENQFRVLILVLLEHAQREHFL